MANAYYDNALNLMYGGGTHAFPDFDADTMKMDLLDAADYTLDTTNDQDYADIPAAAKMTTGGTATLGSITIGTVAAGVVDCADIAFTSVDGDQAEYLVLYHDTGTPSNSPLIGVWDTSNDGLPLLPSGGDVTAVVNIAGLLK